MRVLNVIVVICSVLWASSNFVSLGFVAIALIALFAIVDVLYWFTAVCLLVVRWFIAWRRNLPFWSDRLSMMVKVSAVSFAIVALSNWAGTFVAAESNRRGDELIKLVEGFRAKSGRLPEDLSELKATGVLIPSPAILNSEFRYHVVFSE